MPGFRKAKTPLSMTHAPSALLRTLSHGARLLALGALLASPLARADDYADVNQLLRQGKPAQALAQAERYLADKPRDPQMRFLKGRAQSESGQNAEAIATFEQLTQDYPELAEPYNNLAVLRAGQGQYEQARAALEQAIRTTPSYATAHENLGDVYLRLAAQAYGQALQLNAGSTTAAAKLDRLRALSPAAATGAAPAPAPVLPPLSTPTPPPAPVPAAAPPAPGGRAR